MLISMIESIKITIMVLICCDSVPHVPLVLHCQLCFASFSAATRLRFAEGRAALTDAARLCEDAGAERAATCNELLAAVAERRGRLRCCGGAGTGSQRNASPPFLLRSVIAIDATTFEMRLRPVLQREQCRELSSRFKNVQALHGHPMRVGRVDFCAAVRRLQVEVSYIRS